MNKFQIINENLRDVYEYFVSNLDNIIENIES